LPFFLPLSSSSSFSKKYTHAKTSIRIQIKLTTSLYAYKPIKPTPSTPNPHNKAPTMPQTNPQPPTADDHSVSVKHIARLEEKWKTSHSRLQDQLSALEKADQPPSLNELKALVAALDDTFAQNKELQRTFDKWKGQGTEKYIGWKETVNDCQRVTKIADNRVDEVLTEAEKVSKEAEKVPKANRKWYERFEFKRVTK
jgi:hypothetical protein